MYGHTKNGNRLADGTDPGPESGGPAPKDGS
jgi:hypothetical protein